jgi:prophage maintenance system killer protein
MKEDIRSKTKTKLDEETKESLIRQGKEKAIEEFSTMFALAAKVVIKLFKFKMKFYFYAKI